MSQLPKWRSKRQLTICVFLPAIEFVINGKRNTLLKATFRVRCPSNDVTAHLEPHSHIEILGNMRLGPNFLLAVTINECGVLDGLPSQETAQIGRC